VTVFPNTCSAGKSAKVDIRCDKGVYAGLLAANDWDLLQPLAMTRADFEFLRSRLGGLNEVCRATGTAALNLPGGAPPGETERELMMRVRSSLNIHLVQEPGRGELMLAGCVRKGTTAHRLLLTIISQRYACHCYLADAYLHFSLTLHYPLHTLSSHSPSEVSLRLNCEDPVMCNALGDALFKLLSR
jgi:hypothetical protein